MQNYSHPHDDAHDQLRFENELLNIKLGLEFGMEPPCRNHLDPALENAWLKSIYEFEKQYSNAKKVTVHEAIGCPVIRHLEELRPEEVEEALANIIDLLGKHAIEVDWCCDYPASVRYQFITEELMTQEIEHISADGFVLHFSYESFHPNHKYDLEECTRYFLESLFGSRWNTEFDSYLLYDLVMWRGKSYNRDGIGNLIQTFQADRSFERTDLDFQKITFDLEAGTGCVDCFIAYRAFFQGQEHLFRGDARLTFNYDYAYWRISSFHIPGF